LNTDELTATKVSEIILYAFERRAKN